MRRAGIALLLLVLALLGAVLVAREVGPSSSDDEADGGQTPEAGDASAPGPGGDRTAARAAGAPSGDDLDPATSIRGTVRDAAGEPIVGARVTLHALDRSRRIDRGVVLVDFDWSLAETTTRWDGTFAVPAQPGEPFVVVVSKQGTSPIGRIARAGHDVEFELAPGRALALRVVDIAGAPVQGATIRAFRQFRADEREPDYTTPEARNREVALPAGTTDAEGRCSLVVRDFGDVVVKAPGYATTWLYELEDVGRDGDEHTVVLADGGVVAGVVVDGTGSPLPGTAVWIDPVSSVPSIFHTGPDGSFSFAGLQVAAEATLDFSAEKEGFGELEASVPVGRTDLRIVLRRTGGVRGFVRREDGSPATGAEVGAPTEEDVQVDEQGRFELPRLPAGPQRLRAERRTDVLLLQGDSGIVEVPEGGVLEGVQIVVRPSLAQSRVDVRVIDAEGRPVDRATVWARAPADARLEGSGVTQGDGACRLKVELAPGTPLRVLAATRHLEDSHASPCATADAVSAPLDGAPDDTVVLKLGPPGKLTVRLDDPEGVQIPLSKARFTFDGEPAPSPVDGAWPLHPMRMLTLEVEVHGYARRRLWVNGPHPPVRELRIQMVPSARVDGRIVDGKGRPAPEETVVVVTVSIDGEPQGDSTTLAEAGRFEIDGLAGGEAELVVLDTDQVRRVLRRFRLEVGSTVQLGDVVLPPMEVVEGVVVDERGRGIGGVRIHFEDPDREDVAAPRNSGPDGRFRVPLPRRAGMRFFAQREGYGTSFTEFAPEGPRPARIVLRPGGRVRMRAQSRADDVAARAAGTETWWEPILVESPTSDPGEWTFDCLPAGEVELRTYQDGAEITTRVTVVAGETVEARF